jgi:hypothetical protein
MKTIKNIIIQFLLAKDPLFETLDTNPEEQAAESQKHRIDNIQIHMWHSS